ncbi:unnamed protein product [Dibothriocephalus latus]|uniref:MARVEL domain-containing protein n=1 Tax=Dibothriocephalus latus TaxID=60516 RepID=A0A3P7LRM4_DIBLA|nr:unnamed protein product [Dibothriocephalus latus]
MAGLSTTAQIIKFVVVASNIVAFVFGLALVILGILDLVQFDGPLGAELPIISTAVATAAIGPGLFIIAVAFFGLYGALRANANVLIAYAVIVLLIGCSTLCFLIYAFVQRNTDCEDAIVHAIEAELGTIGGCLIGITILRFFASTMGFVLALNIKAYENV